MNARTEIEAERERLTRLYIADRTNPKVIAAYYAICADDRLLAVTETSDTELQKQIAAEAMRLLNQSMNYSKQVTS